MQVAQQQIYVELTNVSATIEYVAARVDLVRLDPHRIICMITTQECVDCSILAWLNRSLLSATTREDGKVEWGVLISEEALVKLTAHEANSCPC